MPTAQPGQEQRMENAREMLIRRRKDAESLGGSAEIATEELDEAIAALTRPTADLGELVEAISNDECVICGKTKAQHSMSSGFGVCQIYPVFQSKRETVKLLLKQARAVLSRSGG